MKWITTAVAVAVALLATNSRAEGQDVINFVSDQEGANGIRGQQQQIKSSRFKFENEKVLFDTTLLPKKTLIEKPESVGVLSNDKESTTSVHPRDQTLSVLSMSQDIEVYPQAQVAQGRKLASGLDMATFESRCDDTSPAGLSGSNAYVDCFDGSVNGDPSTSCADACIANGVIECCGGDDACDGFTGKVCKDGSCNDEEACSDADIDYVVGPSCRGILSCYNAKIGSVVSSCTGNTACKDATIGSADSSCNDGFSCQGADTNIGSADSSCNKEDSCVFAQIGSVDSSCNDVFSCFDTLLSDVDLINSCNKDFSCSGASGNGEIDELVDCCNEDDQCFIKDGLDIVNAGCPNAPSEMPSEVPSQSSEPSSEPSGLPSISVEPSEVPSTVPSESGKPSLVPSDSPSTSVEPSSSPTKSGKGSGKDNFDEKGKGKTSKVDSRNMASKSDVLAYLSSSEVTSDEKKAFVVALIIGILEHLTGDVNEMD